MSTSINTRSPNIVESNTDDSLSINDTFIGVVDVGKPGKVAMTPSRSEKLNSPAKVLLIGEFGGTTRCQDLEQYMAQFDQPGISIRLDQLGGDCLEDKIKELELLITALRKKGLINSDTEIHVGVHGSSHENKFYLSTSDNVFSIEAVKLLEMLDRGKASPESKGTIQFAVCKSKHLHKKLIDYPHHFIFHSGSHPIYTFASTEIVKKQIAFSYRSQCFPPEPSKVFRNACMHIGSNLAMSGKGKFHQSRTSDIVSTRDGQSTQQLHRHLFYKFGFGSFDSIVRLLMRFDLKALLAENPDLNNLIGFAASSPKNAGEKVIVLLLLGVNPNAADGEGQTALHHACQEGDDELIKCLLQNGSTATAKNKDGKTPRDITIEQGFDDLAQLIDEFSSGRRFPEYSQQSLIFNLLCKSRYRESLQVIVQRQKFWLTAQNDSGDNLLLHSMKQKEYGISEDLIQAGIDVNVPNRNGTTALHYACIRNTSSELIRLLRTHEADFNAKNRRGFTPLIYAARHGRTAQAKLVVRFSGNVNERSLRGNTALHFAVTCNDIEMVKTLLDLGADRTINNDPGYSPLDRARRKGFVEITKLLETYHPKEKYFF